MKTSPAPVLHGFLECEGGVHRKELTPLVYQIAVSANITSAVIAAPTSPGNPEKW